MKSYINEGSFSGCCAVQVVILVVDQGQRPELPADPAQLPGKPLRHISTYLDLMCHCWHQDPAQRPTFERVISHLRSVSQPPAAAVGHASAQEENTRRLAPWYYSLGAARAVEHLCTGVMPGSVVVISVPAG